MLKSYLKKDNVAPHPHPTLSCLLFLIDLKSTIIAIYLKSLFPSYDSNIKFYNSTLYSTKNMEIKTSFYQKITKSKKMRLYTFTCKRIQVHLFC